MLPDANNPVWIQIATGKKPVQSGKLAINLLIQSNKLSYDRDKTPNNAQQLAAKTYAFFSQYENAFNAEFSKILS